MLYPFPDLIEDWSDSVPGMDFTLTHLYASVEETTFVDSNSNSEGLMQKHAEFKLFLETIYESLYNFSRVLVMRPAQKQGQI